MTGAKTAVTQAEQRAYTLAIGRGFSTKQAQSAASAAGQLEQQQQYNNLAQMALNSGISGTPCARYGSTSALASVSAASIWRLASRIPGAPCIHPCHRDVCSPAK